MYHSNETAQLSLLRNLYYLFSRCDGNLVLWNERMPKEKEDRYPSQ